MDNEQTTTTDGVAEAQVAIREGIERARELVCEARLAMRWQATLTGEPPNPARS